MEETKKSEAPALPLQVEEEVDWLDAVPVEIPPQSAQDNDYNISVVSTRPKTNYSEIPQLESDIDEEEEGQFEDIQTYLDHHNTYQESQNICKEYTKRLLDLDDERYYRDIDHMYETYSQDRAHIPDIQTPAPHHMMQELIQAYGRGREQARRGQLHGHLIPTEQDSEENQKDSAHETEIRKYPIRLFHFCNNPIYL